MATENTYIALARDLLDYTEDFSLYLIRRLRQIASALVRNPDARINLQDEIELTSRRFDVFLRQAQGWVDESVSVAYFRGIETANRSVRQAGASLTAGLFMRRLPSPPGPIAPKAAKVLASYPEHHTIYSVFQQAAYSDFAQMKIPVVRQQADRIRQIIIEASEQAYKQADTFTRREFQQELLKRFAEEGIEGVRYSNGRMMKIDSYTEMVARTQTNNASRQATMFRLQEYGIDLVQISVHHPCSPMCEPYQGKVFSVSGTSDRYMALDDAIADGLFHPNCKHFMAGYTPGVNELPDPQMSVSRNNEQYKALQQQRYNERQIRAWKRRHEAALTEKEKEFAEWKVKEWQYRQRKLINENDFLRRDYSREQV